MLLKYLLIILLPFSNGFQPSSSLVTNRVVFPENSVKLLLDQDCKLIDKLIHLELPNKKEVGRNIVELISSSLPKVDTIGHTVLHANNEFISYILNLNEVPDHFKKDIILLSIKLAQYGDDAGSHLLQLYYDIVEKCL